jgi:DNA-binding beta-propeller fold protein YncE
MNAFRRAAPARARAAPIGFSTLIIITIAVASASGQEGFVPAFTPASAFVWERVVFHADPPGASREGYQFSWKFGDGSEATAYADHDSAEHVFAAPGRYAILLRYRKDGIVQSANRLLSVNGRPTAARPSASSTLIGSRDGAFLWCVNPDQNSVTRIEAGNLEAILEIPVGSNPSALAEGPEGLIWVANKGSASVTLLDPRSGSAVKTLALPYASQPHGLVFSPDRKFAYVALQAIGKVAVLDAAVRSVLHLVSVGATPRALALSQDGSLLLSPSFVSRQTGGVITALRIGAGGAAAPGLEKAVPIAPQGGGDTEGNGRGVPNSLATVVFSPDGRRAFFAGKKDNVARGKARDGLALTFENTVRTTVFSLDLSDLTSRMEDRFDIDNSNLPTALIFSPRGDQLYVALEGNRQVRVLDPYNGGSELTRITGTGPAPGGLLIDEERNRLYVHCLLDRSVEAYDIRGVLDNTDYAVRKLAAVRTIASETLPPQVLAGKQLFHSADSLLGRDGYMSCAACHPDGRSDGMVWDFTDRGEGLRKTIPLIGRAGTGSRTSNTISAAPSGVAA